MVRVCPCWCERMRVWMGYPRAIYFWNNFVVTAECWRRWRWDLGVFLSLFFAWSHSDDPRTIPNEEKTTAQTVWTRICICFVFCASKLNRSAKRISNFVGTVNVRIVCLVWSGDSASHEIKWEKAAHLFGFHIKWKIIPNANCNFPIFLFTCSELTISSQNHLFNFTAEHTEREATHIG